MATSIQSNRITTVGFGDNTRMATHTCYTTLSYLFQNLIEKFVETNKIYIPSKDLKKRGWGHIGMGGYT
jgi:hypothetical protein